AKVDDLGSLVTRHVEAVGNGIDSENPTRSQELGAGDSELAHRTAAKDCDGVAALHLGEFSAKIACRKNIGAENRLLIVDVVRELDAAHIGEWDAGVLGLESMDGAA